MNNLKVNKIKFSNSIGQMSPGKGKIFDGSIILDLTNTDNFHASISPLDLNISDILTDSLSVSNEDNLYLTTNNITTSLAII